MVGALLIPPYKASDVVSFAPLLWWDLSLQQSGTDAAGKNTVVSGALTRAWDLSGNSRHGVYGGGSSGIPMTTLAGRNIGLPTVGEKYVTSPVITSNLGTIIAVCSSAATPFSNYRGLVTGSDNTTRTIILGNTGGTSIYNASPWTNGSYRNKVATTNLAPIASGLFAVSRRQSALVSWSQSITFGRDSGVPAGMYPWYGHLAELIVYPGAITLTEFNNLIDGLARKWGFTV
jgi:hypothetical protein